MKKTLIFILIAALFTFASCSDDDDNTGQQITGTWELTATNPAIIPGLNLFSCPNNPEITFNSDGTASWVLYDAENNCAEVSSSGTWVQNSDGSYTVTIPQLGTVDGTVVFSGPNQFNFNTSIESFPVVLTFQR